MTEVDHHSELEPVQGGDLRIIGIDFHYHFMRSSQAELPCPPLLFSKKNPEHSPICFQNHHNQNILIPLNSNGNQSKGRPSIGQIRLLRCKLL
jgi:hypothetical protein